MSVFLLSLCSPFWLSIVVLTASISLLIPPDVSWIGPLLAAALPLLAVLICTHWIDRVSDLFRKSGKPFKASVLLLSMLIILDDNNYYVLIANARHISSSPDSILVYILQAVSSILLYSSSLALLLVLATMLVELVSKLIAGKNCQELNPFFEAVKLLLFIITLGFSGEIAVSLLLRSA
jgi:hypothetical protein